jgi:hypothetical protein
MSPLLFSLVIWDGSVALITGGCLGLGAGADRRATGYRAFARQFGVNTWYGCRGGVALYGGNGRPLPYVSCEITI